MPPPIRGSSTRSRRVETPVAYLDAPELRRFWDADARKLAEAVQRVGKVSEGRGRGEAEPSPEGPTRPEASEADTQARAFLTDQEAE